MLGVEKRVVAMAPAEPLRFARGDRPSEPEPGVVGAFAVLAVRGSWWKAISLGAVDSPEPVSRVGGIADSLLMES